MENHHFSMENHHFSMEKSWKIMKHPPLPGAALVSSFMDFSSIINVSRAAINASRSSCIWKSTTKDRARLDDVEYMHVKYDIYLLYNIHVIDIYTVYI